MRLVEIANHERLQAESDDDGLQQLYGYWSERRAGRTFPTRQDIDPLDFAYALGRVSLIEVAEDPPRYFYRLVSTALTSRLGYEMSRKSVDQIPEAQTRDYTKRFYDEMVDRAVPVFFQDELVLDDRHWKHAGLCLPLSSDGRRVDMLMIYRNAQTMTPSGSELSPVGL